MTRTEKDRLSLVAQGVRDAAEKLGKLRTRRGLSRRLGRIIEDLSIDLDIDSFELDNLAGIERPGTEMF